MNDKKLDFMRRIKNGESFEKCSREDSDYIKELKDCGLVKAIDFRTSAGNSWRDVRLTLAGEEELECLSKLEYQENEEWIDKLLTFMHKLECEKGEDIVFSFLEDGEHTKLFLSSYQSLLYSDLCYIIKICIHQNYLNQGTLEELKSVRLRVPGKERARLVLAVQKKSKVKAFFENKYIYGIIMLLIGMVLGSGWTSLKKCLTNKNENPNTISAGVTNKLESVENVVTNFIKNSNANTNNLEVKGENLNEEN